MSKSRTNEPASLFKLLADPTRVALLNLLIEREVCVCDLHGTLGVVQPKVSRHLAQMRRAGIVQARRDGKWMHYRLATPDDPLARNVLNALRRWLRAHPRMTAQRRRLEKVCCSNKKTKGRQSRRS
jgi:ArsR family transcriptional regulator